MKKIRKHLFLLGVFIKNCLIGYIEYRANFIMEMVSEIAYILLKIVYLFAIFNTKTMINDDSSAIILIIGGNYMILTGIFVGFFMENFFSLSEKIRNGDLDIIIIKPISTLFMVTFRNFQFGAAIPNIIIGTLAFAMGISRMDCSVTLIDVGFYILMMISAVVLTYSVFLLFVTIGFWTDKTDSLTDMLENMWDQNNMPMSIYNKYICRFMIFVVPMFVISNFPILALMESLSSVYFIWGIIAPVIFFVLSKKFFGMALKKYSSASS